MKFLDKKSLKIYVSGIAVGIVNGMLGAGGGIIAVPILKKLGVKGKKAHANAVAVILPVTVLSAVIYVVKDYVSISDAVYYIPGGIAGAFLGTLIMKKISPLWLKRIFGGFMAYAGIRLLIR